MSEIIETSEGYKFFSRSEKMLFEEFVEKSLKVFKEAGN
jgi:hypothetical protein